MSDPDARNEPLSTAEFERLMAPFAQAVGAHLAVGVSGGADSLALALLLADWARSRGVRVTALSVDHGLRPQSAAEAHQVAVWLTAQGLEHHILRWREGAPDMSGLQANARDARYGLLGDWCRTNGVGHLFVAHHLGDQAETFVMRLARASTLFGLAAMGAVRDVDGVDVCRPLLGVTKDRLQATLNARGQAWLEDPSNSNFAFERVRTRALIGHLHDDGVTVERLAGAARAAGRLKAIVDRAVAAFEGAAVTLRTDQGLSVDGEAFAALPTVVQERALGTLLRRVHAQPYSPSPAKIERLAAWMGGAGVRGGARTLGGCVVRRTKGGFSIVPEKRRVKPQEKLRDTPAEAKKGGVFIASPLPPGLKSLTSRTGGAALDDVCALTKC